VKNINGNLCISEFDKIEFHKCIFARCARYREGTENLFKYYIQNVKEPS